MVFHAELDKKGSVVLENLKFETVIEKGIYIYGCTKAILKDIQIKEGRNCIYYCGLSLERIDDISIRNLDLRDSHQALSISQSKGLIEDSKIVRNTRPVLFTADGGGLRVSESELTSRNLELMENKAMGSGGGFYCSNSTLTMFGGKIHKNVAVKAGGAGECVKDCKFSMLGVDISSNTQTDPSNCKGIPNLLKRIENQEISK